jgi:hypothetical protein
MITTIVGFAISMMFLYLMLSAACSAIQEIAANLMKWRAQTLEKGLAGLFLNDQFKNKLYTMPLVKGLCSPDTRGNLSRKPSYIPPASLALAVLDLAKQEGMNLSAATATHATFSETEKLLQSIVRGSATVDEQKTRLEDWYNDSMSRVSGWYKRKAHAWIWIFSIILCLALNADSLTLGQKFWNDQTLRDAVVKEATDYVQNPANKPPSDTVTAPSDGSPTEFDNSLSRVIEVQKKLPGVPVGWCFANNPSETKAVCWPNLDQPLSLDHPVVVSPKDPRRVDGHFLSWWFWKIIGIALTSLAVSQGAPFWFDLLQKVVNLRLAGARPSTEPAK